MRRRLLLPVAALLLLPALAACGSGSDSKDNTSSAAAATAPAEVRLGYFPNITHATAIVGVKNGIFAKDLGQDTLKTQTFNAGPAAVEALFSGALDATFIGPSPAINAYQKSHGEAIRIVSGATSGGAALVTRSDITSADQLNGMKLATPQLGNTQDVALRAWLKSKGLKTDPQGGGDVQILPQENSQTLDTFKQGKIDGAWVPEPWATRLVIEGKGKVLVDEATLWPGGKYLTTTLIVRTAFLKDHPQTVERLLKGLVETSTWVNGHPSEAQQVVNTAIQEITGKALTPDVISTAWKSMRFTTDPLLSTLEKEKRNAVDVGLLQAIDLSGIADLGPLNTALRAAGQPTVKS